MNTLIDLDEAQTAALERLSRAKNQSPEELIGAAIDAYIGRHQRDGITQGFGLWGDRAVDGLKYQEWVRGEW